MTYDNNNIFAKILREEIPCKKIYEDEAFHNKITKIGHEFLNAYLANKGNAAENIAHYIKKLVNEKCQIH